MTLERTIQSIGNEVINWIETHCVYPSGPKIGDPFILMEWQRKWIRELFEVDEAGSLVYRWALLGIPKGNGKSTLIAALALYHLLGDFRENDPWAVCAAASDKQADIVFSAARTMCELSPTLKQATNRFRWEIRPKNGHGVLERVAAAGGKLDGKLPSMLLADELHEWSLDNWVILTNGAGKRARSQIIQITTAGYDRDSICYTEYERCMRAQKGEIDLPGYLFRWHGAEDGSDWKNPDVWKSANPSYGELMTFEQLEDQNRNKPESQFRRYFLNQWTATEETWLPQGAWDACKVEGLTLVEGAPTWVGWDASTKYDSTAIVAVQRVNGKMRAHAKIWERPQNPDGSPVEEWQIPGAEMREYVRRLWRTYRPAAISFDPAFITWEAQELANEGAPMIDWPQTDNRMIPATQETYDAIMRRELEHDGDPAFARHMGNAMAVQTNRGGQRITKGKTRRIRNQIDAAVALCMAVDLAMRNPTGPPVLPIGYEGDGNRSRPEFAGLRGQTF